MELSGMLISIGIPGCTRLQGRSGVGEGINSFGVSVGVPITVSDELVGASVGLRIDIAGGRVFAASSVTRATEVWINADSSSSNDIGVETCC